MPGWGSAEYWILDPVDSDDPAHCEHGLLLPDGPLMVWRLEQDCYEPLDTFWDAAARTWTAYSPTLACDIILSQELHREETDGGYRILDPETGEPLASDREKDDLLAEKDEPLAKQVDQLAEKKRAIKEAVTTMAQLRYGASTADQLRLMMQGPRLPCRKWIGCENGWRNRHPKHSWTWRTNTSDCPSKTAKGFIPIQYDYAT